MSTGQSLKTRILSNPVSIQNEQSNYILFLVKQKLIALRKFMRQHVKLIWTEADMD